MIFVIGIIIVWLFGLSVILLRAVLNYNRLTLGSSASTLSEILNKFLDTNNNLQLEHQKIFDELKQLQKISEHCVQKIGLVRFNPYQDTGGDQSFTLALLDKAHTGLVITSLYSRSGARWFIKKITEGKAVDVALSKEEREAVEAARKQNCV